MELELGLSEILHDFTMLPTSIVMDLSQPVRRIFSVFDPSPMNLIGPEYVIDQAVEACTSRISAHRDISKFARRLLGDLQATKERRSIALQEFSRDSDYVRNLEHPYPHVGFLEQAIIVEQAALDMLDQFLLFKLYVNNQWLPYRYETMESPHAVMLTKFQTAEEFLDRIAYVNT